MDGTLSYTCPSGFTLVLRDLDTYSNELLETSVHLIGSEGQTIWYNGFAAGGNPQYAGWRGRQVLTTGEDVTITASGGVDVTLGGYLLVLP